MSNPQASNAKFENKPIRTEPVEDLATQYRQAYPKLVAIAAGVLGGREDAEDVVQHAVGIAIEKAPGFDAAAPLARWLAGIVRHVALNYRRKRVGRRTYAADPYDLSRMGKQADQPATALPIHPQSGELLPDQAAFDDEVLRALHGLSDEARCCLLLRTVNQLSYAEISDLMQIPAGTAMSHVHRSKQALRLRLANHEAAR